MTEPAAWICPRCGHFIVVTRPTPSCDCPVANAPTAFVPYIDSQQAETIRRQLPVARR